jgi:hypothetical protein
MKWTFLSAIAVSSHLALADPVWHCSRTSLNATETKTSQSKENHFSIASLNATEDTIGVSIGDLIDVYSGVAVRIGGLPLSACFMPANKEATNTALTSLGLQPVTIEALARKSVIVQSNLYVANTSTQMIDCIAQNYPAVGYLEEVSSTDKVEPCF